MQSGLEINSPWDAHVLYKEGKLELLKSKLIDKRGVIYKVMRFENVMGGLKMWLEDPYGKTTMFDLIKTRAHQFRLIEKEGFRAEYD